MVDYTTTFEYSTFNNFKLHPTIPGIKDAALNEVAFIPTQLTLLLLTWDWLLPSVWFPGLYLLVLISQIRLGGLRPSPSPAVLRWFLSLSLSLPPWQAGLPRERKEETA